VGVTYKRPSLGKVAPFFVAGKSLIATNATVEYMVLARAAISTMTPADLIASTKQ